MMIKRSTMDMEYDRKTKTIRIHIVGQLDYVELSLISALKDIKKYKEEG